MSPIVEPESGTPPYRLSLRKFANIIQCVLCAPGQTTVVKFLPEDRYHFIFVDRGMNAGDMPQTRDGEAAHIFIFVLKQLKAFILDPLTIFDTTT